ncbi:MAG TPA: MGMT family protein [Candidatus Bathyarchaeia archaeon]
MIEIYAQNIEDTWFAIALNQQQIIASSFGADHQTTIKNVLSKVPFNMAFQIFHQPIPSAKNILMTLKRVYDGKKVEANLSLATTHLPIYTKKVLKTTESIPLGYVTSYGAIAKAAGGGPRAVGNIMASNPFAPIVPCHRVVRSDFTLGGYGFGLKIKIQLLGREKRGFSSSKTIEVNDKQLTVFPVEYVLKNFA